MPDAANAFERRVNIAAQRIGRGQETVDKVFGVGSRPYNSHKLTPTEKVQWFNSQDPAKKMELWAQMDQSERALVSRG